MPVELCVRLGGVADQDRDISRPEETFVLYDVGPPVIYSHMMKGGLEKVANGMALTGCYDVVFRFLLLEHEPHCLNVVSGEAPVPGHVHVADGNNLLVSQRYPRDPARHLTGE